MVRIYAALSRQLLVVDDDQVRVRRPGDRRLQCLAADVDRVFVGTDDAGVYRSLDGGASFERTWTDTAAGTVPAIALSPQDPDVVWAGTEPSAVYRSADGGDSWHHRDGLTDLPSASQWSFPPRPHTHRVHWIEPDSTEPGRLYVAIEAGALVRSPDGGDTWWDRPEGALRDTHQLATHPGAPGRVYAGGGDGYVESPDRGDSWHHREEGLDHRYVWSVAVDPADPDHVLASSASSAYRAHDPDGESYVYARRDGAWELAMDGLPGPEGVARPTLTTGPEGAFYALSNHGLFRSADGCRWDRLDVPWSADYREQLPRGLAVV